METIIYLLINEQEIIEKLSKHLADYNYKISNFNNFSDLKSAIAKQKPSIIFMQSDFIKDVHENFKLEGISLIVYTKQEDINIRLAAAKIGAIACFIAPLDYIKLLHAINKIRTEGKSAPHHVLIVDDSEAIAKYHAALLENHKIITKILTNPLNIKKVIFEFQPDLILMDVYMPECTGPEIAEVLRQEDEYAGIPIVFLSSEDDRDKQLAAMGVGAEEFLIKPIKEEHLVSSVKTRIERSRMLQSYMIRDSLTDLFNHTTFKHFLEVAIAQAQRSSQPISVVMLDLDHFKHVNDKFGHILGDKVIKCLAEILLNSLRKSDIAGRVGGEEFGVILPDTPVKNAKILMDNILKRFSEYEHTSDKGNFFVTFSAGIAAFPEFETVSDLTDAADKALYQAKEMGRNCVITYNKKK